MDGYSFLNDVDKMYDFKRMPKIDRSEAIDLLK